MGDVERLADRFAVLVGGRLVAVFTQRELASRLADRGLMRVRVERPSVELLARVRERAPRAVRAGDEIIVPGSARIRPEVLDIIRAAGGVVAGLTAEEGRLDRFYQELVDGGGR
jgi:Cu-processing system ATP-binding protein